MIKAGYSEYGIQKIRKSELILAIVSALSLASCGGSGSSSSGGGSSDSGSGTANISVSLDVLNGKDSAVIYPKSRFIVT